MRFPSKETPRANFRDTDSKVFQRSFLPRNAHLVSLTVIYSSFFFSRDTQLQSQAATVTQVIVEGENKKGGVEVKMEMHPRRIGGVSLLTTTSFQVCNGKSRYVSRCALKAVYSPPPGHL